jgi:hypothetical protein
MNNHLLMNKNHANRIVSWPEGNSDFLVSNLASRAIDFTSFADTSPTREVSCFDIKECDWPQRLFNSIRLL